MLALLIFLVVVGGLAYRVSTPDDREQFLAAALVYAKQARILEARGRLACAPFHDALRARTPWALVTPAIVVLNVAVFVCMLFGTGKLSEPATLIGWGGSFGPRTTNGEWWRLVTLLFVHQGMFQLLVNLVGLIQAGLILERLVGRFAFAAVYIASGVFAGLVSLSTQAVAVHVGAAGAVFGVYGLLLTTSIWGLLRRSPLTMPVGVVVRLVPAAVMFLLCALATDGLEGRAELTGLAVGLIYGVVWGRSVNDRKPAVYRIAVATFATAAIAVLSAVPLRGVSDVRPEIARVVAIEGRMASAYDTAVNKFKSGRITAEALIEVIDRTIMPDLQAERARVKALDGVPREHQALVAAAEEYLRLRDESWRLRAEGLHKANMRTLQKAELSERASLVVLETIKPVETTGTTAVDTGKTSTQNAKPKT